MDNLFKLDGAIFLSLLSIVICTELIPERYLRPRDFNHHPFTDVGGLPASLKSPAGLPDRHPYAILLKKKPREGRQFPHQDKILYPTPHPSVLPKKHLETNEINYDDDSYVNVPKNYAFSYSVRDAHSGDDFSHSQAHNGKATRGQYRVKLPDGRVQVVSYTADHKGYRADVQYEEESVAQPVAVPKPTYQHSNLQNSPQTPNALPAHRPNTLQTLEHYLRHRVVQQPSSAYQQEEPSQSIQQQVYHQPQIVYVSTQKPPTQERQVVYVSTQKTPTQQERQLVYLNTQKPPEQQEPQVVYVSTQKPTRQQKYHFVPVYTRQPEFGARTPAPQAHYITTPGPERFSLNQGLSSTNSPHLVSNYNPDQYIEAKLRQKYAATPATRYVSSTIAPQYLSTTIAPHASTTQEPQYVSSQEPQYASTQEPQYASSQEPQYVSSEEPQYASSQEQQYDNRQETQYDSSEDPRYLQSGGPQYATSTPAPIYIGSSTAQPLYATPTTGRPHYVSSTPEGEREVLVTPRTYKKVIFRYVQQDPRQQQQLQHHQQQEQIQHHQQHQ